MQYNLVFKVVRQPIQIKAFPLRVGTCRLEVESMRHFYQSIALVAISVRLSTPILFSSEAMHPNQTKKIEGLQCLTALKDYFILIGDWK